MCSLEVWVFSLARAVERHKSGVLRACGYFHGGLKSQSPHLKVELWLGLKNCRLNPNRSSGGRGSGLSPHLSLFCSGGLKGAQEGNWSSHPLLLARMIPKQTLKKKGKSKARSRAGSLLLLTGPRCPISHTSILPWVLVTIYEGCLSLSTWPLEF